MKRVWIAEDDGDLREMLAFVLRKSGFEVDEFSDGSEVLKALADEALPDLLVTDHHMGSVNGMDVVTDLRSRGLGAELPVVMVTAFAEPQLRIEAARLKVVLIEKPCKIYDVRDVVLERLS